MSTRITQREPLITSAVLVALVTAGLGLAASFGLEVTQEQEIQILAFLAVVAPFAVALIGRTQVWPVTSVDKLADEALEVDSIDPFYEDDDDEFEDDDEFDDDEDEEYEYEEEEFVAAKVAA